MAQWEVDYDKNFEKQLKRGFKDGTITKDDVQIVKRWVAEIEEYGLEHAQANRTWRDHELEGEWERHRAISFSYSGRLIYRVENEKVRVLVVRITPTHDYGSS